MEEIIDLTEGDEDEYDTATTVTGEEIPLAKGIGLDRVEQTATG